jgi:carboxymethylenebutenolidase
MGRMITLEASGPFDAYVAEPDPALPVVGGVLVIHEIWGLVDHIKDVADRFAAEGYVAIAPDLLGRVGISAHVGSELHRIASSDDPAVRSAGQPRLREAMAPMNAPGFSAWATTALQDALDFLELEPGVGNRVAVVGFCFGGSYAFALAAADPRIRAAVPFYGSPPLTTEVDRIAAPVLAFYGDQDERLMRTLPELRTAMEHAGTPLTATIYEGVGHAFFNDTNPHAYNAEAAADAWQRTLRFLVTALAA